MRVSVSPPTAVELLEAPGTREAEKASPAVYESEKVPFFEVLSLFEKMFRYRDGTMGKTGVRSACPLDPSRQAIIMPTYHSLFLSTTVHRVGPQS